MISVILPCFNGAETIALQLEALANQQWAGDWELIISNNGSTDNSMEIVEQFRDRLPLRIVNAYTSGPRLGVSHSYNTGLKEAMGNAFAFCEADDEVTPNWLANIAESLKVYPCVSGVLDLRRLNPDWAIAAFGESIQTNGLCQFDFIPFLPFGYGCNFGFRRSVWEQVGRLNVAIRYGWDMDYCWRIQRAGFPVQFVPELKIHYRLRHTLKALYRQSRSWSEDQVLMRRLYHCPIGRLALVKDSIATLLCLTNFLKVRNRADFAASVSNVAWHVGRVQGDCKYFFSGKFNFQSYLVSEPVVFDYRPM
jgi:glycosyltransferase involved in cell wall biosynthesis